MSGKPDYWRKSVISKTTWSEDQEFWWKTGYSTFNGAGSHDFVFYDVPNDKSLNLYVINWSSDFPYMFKGVLRRNDIVILESIFELNWNMVFGSNAGIYFEPGDSLVVGMTNYVADSVMFRVNLFGFLEAH